MVLQAMTEHRTINLIEKILADLNHVVVWSDAQNLLVECGMMDLAQCQTVSYGRDACFLSIRNDVGGIKKLSVPQ